MKDHIRILADLQKEANIIILNKYSPAGVVVDDAMKIIQFKGDTSLYLGHAPGEASLDLMKIADKGLATELRNALHTAKKENAPVRKEGLRIKYGGKSRLAAVEVIPFKAPGTRDLHFLILFEETPSFAPLSGRKGKGVGKPAVIPKGQSEHEETVWLRHELAATRQYLNLVMAEHEAASEEAGALNEELQTNNDEMQSINEEMQSTNEEMETAREELQSTNEELTTVNDELGRRSEEMTLLNNDLINVLSGIEIPIVLLGNELQIRRFNPSAGKILNLIDSDAGRPITDIRTNINVPDLKQLLGGVIDTLVIRGQEIQTMEGRWYFMTIRPYRTVDSRIDGVLMTLVDIDELKQTVAEREKLISELKEAMAGVKQLSGMLPICASCKKIRDDKGYWSQIESYITDHSEALFSHGYCPECAEKVMLQIDEVMRGNETGYNSQKPKTEIRDPE